MRALARLVLCAAAAAVANAAPPEPEVAAWAQWRGPLGSGVAPRANPPVEWSEGKNVRWKVEIPGRGHATPIVFGDRIYIQTAIRTDKTPAGDAADAPAPQDPPPGDRPRRRRGGDKPKQVHQFAVLALDRKTGATVWQTVVREEVPHEAIHDDSTNASSSPVTDGRHIYAYFGSRGLYCLDQTGKLIWEADFGDMHTRNEFGEGSSPALWGDTVVVQWDHERDDFVVALDAATGKERWRQTRDEPTSWATPIIVAEGDAPQVVTSSSNFIQGYDLKTGEPLWQCGGMTMNVIPSPIYDNGVLYAVSGFRGAAAVAIRLSAAKGNVTESKAVLWRYDRDTPYVPSPLLYRDRLYFVENNKPILTCLNARTGERVFGPQRIEGIRGIYASIVGAANRVYIVGRDGTTVVLKHGDDYEVLATNKLDDEFDASPAIVDGELFLRGAKHLYCIAKPE